MKVYKIGIVDDHLLFAEGISNIIANKNNLELSFIVSSVPLMYEAMQKHAIDFLFLDINLPPYNGIEVMNQLKQENEALKIMILSMYQPIDIGLDLLKFKGDAYLLKISGKNILEEALESMMLHKQYLDPNILNEEPISDLFTTKLKLSNREKEIISLIAIGKTSKEIANILFLSELTIKTHRKNISEKLGSKGIADFIAKSNEIHKST
jgi:DNA-binding NarL/FixJ family response regulator